MKNWVATAATVFIVFLFASFLIRNGNTDNAAVIPVYAQPEVVATVGPSPSPYPTVQQVLNPATATAIAPLRPTVAPTPAPTLIPDSFAPGGENDAIFSLWFGRIVGVAVLVGSFWIAYLIYQLNMYKIEKDTELKKAEIDAMARMKINPRPILSTTITDGGDGIKLSNGQTVARELVVEFLKSPFNQDERGLAVSRWKTSPGWAQTDIENILDHLGKAGMVTERTSGRACEWLVVPEKGQLARAFRLSPFEIEDF